MLQRIQSIYLLFASLVLFALFFFPLAHNVYVSGKPVSIMVTGIFQDVNGAQQNTESFTALTAITAIAALIPLVVIFLYKNRKQQITICYVAIAVLIGYSFWMAQTVKKAIGSVQLDTHTMGIGIFLTSLSIVLLILAAKSIQRDEKLVKSADRLR
jgi:RsiW-degrading membrane proteinase PrsW (M82 family)